jgi:hypothetical protein
MRVSNLRQSTLLNNPSYLILAVCCSSNVQKRYRQGKMVDCYCGCDTKANRIKFAVAGTLYLLAMCAFSAATSSLLKCYKKIDWGAHHVAVSPCRD